MATFNRTPKISKHGLFPFQIDIKQFMGDVDLLSLATFRLARQLGDMTEPLTLSVKAVIQRTISKNFQVGGRPTWPGLSLKRLNFKLDISASLFRPLIYSGALYQWSTSFTVWRITRDSADMEALDRIVPYGKYHQTGTRTMPQRQFAVLQLQDIEGIVVIFDAWIRANFGKTDFWPYDHRGL